jgi:two-component system chemotaxis sensor kinase CheA
MQLKTRNPELETLPPIHYSPFTIYYSFVDQTQREFLVEIEELVEQIFADLDELRDLQADGRPTRKQRLGRQLIDRIFRRVHSVKGSAASCGLGVVSHIAHEFENLLAEIRGGQVLVNNSVVDTCESATEALSESLSLAASGVVEPSRRALFERLQAAASKPGEAAALQGDAKAVLRNVPFEIWESLTEPERQRLVSIVGEGSPLFVVATNFDTGNFDVRFFRLKEKLTELGEVISTAPAVDDQHPERINFRILYASAVNLQDIEAAGVDFSQVVFKEIGNPASASGSPGADGTPAGASKPASPPPSLASLSNFVRIDLDKLDRLISSTHELLRTTSNALELALSEQQLTKRARRELQKLDAQIRSRFLGVEDKLINLRMVSLGLMLQRAVRAGKAAARLAGKEIDFEIVGGDLRLDKLFADAIADPITHLVRNAVDHGIENNEERVQAGKKRRGTVRIEAVSEGSQSRLSVVDDGRGIDPLRVSQAALRLGILPGNSTLDIEGSLRLIFRPGFTTLTSASDVSGRGVGLDVVETAVEYVGGELRVSSKPGEGTTFEVLLPVTFGLVATNVVVSAGNRYCIPAAQTLGIDAIDVIDGSSAANQLRQVSIRDLLGQPEEPEDSTNQLHLITCQFTDEQGGIGNQESKCVGIVVDRVEGPQEVLVRSLGRHAGRWYGIAGAAELKDGTIALVLDLPRLLVSLE